jgi:hypothetical protein
MTDGSSNPPPSGSSFKFDMSKWTKTERNVGIATLVFFISLFLPWFGVSIVTAYYHVGGSVNGLWHGYMYVALLVSLALVVYLVMLAGLPKLPFNVPLSHRQVLVIGTGIDFVLALISFITKPSGTSWNFGAYLGLVVAAIAVAPFLIPAVQAKMGAKN